MEEDTAMKNKVDAEISETVSANQPGGATLLKKFKHDYQPTQTHQFFGIIDVTLKRPAEVVHALINNPKPQILFSLLTILILCLTGIGIMMGNFSGGDQLWAVPLKVLLGTTLSAFICLPSLFILVCLSGGNQSFGQVARLMLLALVLSGILFVGFLPVAWIFSEATNSEVFMGILYMAIWGIGLFFGMRLMKTSFRFLNNKTIGSISLWVIIFVMVLLQMSTTLRPLIGTFEPLQFVEKKFFISHWIDVAKQ